MDFIFEDYVEKENMIPLFSLASSGCRQWLIVMSIFVEVTTLLVVYADDQSHITKHGNLFSMAIIIHTKTSPRQELVSR